MLLVAKEIGMLSFFIPACFHFLSLNLNRSLSVNVGNHFFSSSNVSLTSFM